MIDDSNALAAFAGVHGIQRYLRYDDLRALGIKYSRVHLRRLMAAGRFPAAVQLSPNRIAWRQGDIVAWDASRPSVGAAAST
jgi:predicted DNA-binding transcriptional regulator AlpA